MVLAKRGFCFCCCHCYCYCYCYLLFFLFFLYLNFLFFSFIFSIELVVDETKRKRKKSLRDTRHTMDNMASSSESAGKSSQSADSPHFERDKKIRTKTSKKRPNETDEGMERIAIENNNPFKESFEKEKNEPPQETNGKTMTTSGKKSRPQSVIANNEQHPFTDLANSDPPEDKTVGSAVVRKRSSSTSKHKRKSSKSSDSSPSLNSSRQKISQLEENDEEDSHDHKHGHTGEPSMLRHNHHNESNNLNATVVNEAAPTRKLTLRAKFMRLVGLTDKDGNDGNKQ